MDLGRLGAIAAEGRKSLGIVTEYERVLSLPRKTLPPEGELIDRWSKELRVNDRARDLRWAQAAIFEAGSWAYTQPGPYGLIGSVGVGKGKTLALMLLSRVFKAKRPLLLVPPSVREQTLDAEWDWQPEYNITATTDDIEEWKWSEGDMRYIVTYGQLSQPSATALLEELQPDLILADECQNLANPKAARTRRFLRYMDKHRADVRFCALSGTLTQAKLEDYAHLVHLALLDKSPLPRNNRDLEHWSAVLDWGAEPDTASLMAIRPLIDWSQVTTTGDVQADGRKALGERFITCPGFVVTTSSSCDAHLVLRAEYPEVTPSINQALGQLRQYYLLPDGTEVVEAMHFAANAGHLSMGFYYQWDWEYGEPDEPWLEARRFWASEVRRYLGRWAREGCDSPFLVEQHVAREKTPATLYTALMAWRKQRKKPPPPVKSVWFDFSVIAWAVDWAKRQDVCILWFRSRAVGEMLEQFGIPTMWGGTPDPGATPCVALSINVYHAGHELQGWHNQLVLEPMPNGLLWQQLMGRTHRQGQPSDQVHVSVCQHTWPLRNRLHAAMGKAEYIEATTYEPQKLLFAERQGFRE